MANAEWDAFCTLLDIDGSDNDNAGVAARSVQQGLMEYMKLRFGVEDIRQLIDIINDAAVVAAVTASIQHQNQDAQAISDAVQAVIAGA